LDNVKAKLVFISGDRDSFYVRDVGNKYKEYLIGNMGHLFFGHEKEIAEIIRKNL
jgi:hypothetical protein